MVKAFTRIQKVLNSSFIQDGWKVEGDLLFVIFYKVQLEVYVSAQIEVQIQYEYDSIYKINNTHRTGPI